ncbi:MAG: FtsL-like putative cell division protein [Flavobacteriaceae bacterium]|nr:FtsL-like putative cell division protein [Flavobacteriaceae bacterium]
MKPIVQLLNVDFLTNKKSIRTWSMIAYLSFLGVLMISSGHITDNKSYRIQILERQVFILKTELIDLQAQLLEVSKPPPRIKIAQGVYLEQPITAPIEIKIEHIEL